MIDLFKENQKFTQWWLWVLLLGLGLIPTIGLYKQLVLGETFGSNPMSDTGLVIFSICFYGFILLFRFMGLHTEIDQNHIHIRFFPFFKKQIPWESVENAQMVTYGFVGGWGIRLTQAYGTVYNIKGNKGLAIVLKNGKKLLVGTQKEAELLSFLNQIQRSSNQGPFNSENTPLR